MNINDLTIGQAKELTAMFSNGSNAQATPAKQHPFTGKTVVVRTYASGVHFAKLAEYDYQHRTAILEHSQRIWSWTGAFTLSEIATDGVKSAKMSVSLPTFFVTQIEEMIPVTSDALASLTSQGTFSA